jgi:ubiquinone/menaquinone biosynthesis C-methylase UbiE
MNNPDYVLSSGDAGRERLRILARVMERGTRSLLDKASVGPGQTCLDVACGGGDVSLILADQVGPNGRVVGVDLDEVKLEIARNEAQYAGKSHLSYQKANVFDLPFEAAFDVVYSRFLLTHLADPAAALTSMLRTLKPGGVMILEDIDFSAHFCVPDCPAVWTYVELYSRTTQSTGGDADIGPQLQLLLKAAGCVSIDMYVYQPAGIEGEDKLICPLTMESVGPRAIAAGMTTQEIVDSTVAELYAAAADPDMVVSAPRMFQSWGYRPE